MTVIFGLWNRVASIYLQCLHCRRDIQRLSNNILLKAWLHLRLGWIESTNMATGARWQDPIGLETIQTIVKKTWTDGLHPVQLELVSGILDGQDILCCALVLLECNAHPDAYPAGLPTRKRPIGVVITPTKGLANNIVHFLPFSHVARSPLSRFLNCQNWTSPLSRTAMKLWVKHERLEPDWLLNISKDQTPLSLSSLCCRSDRVSEDVETRDSPGIKSLPYSVVAYNVSETAIDMFDIDMWFGCKMPYTQGHREIPLSKMVPWEYKRANSADLDLRDSQYIKPPKLIKKLTIGCGRRFFTIRTPPLREAAIDSVIYQETGARALYFSHSAEILNLPRACQVTSLKWSGRRPFVDARRWFSPPGTFVRESWAISRWTYAAMRLVAHENMEGRAWNISAGDTEGENGAWRSE